MTDRDRLPDDLPRPWEQPGAVRRDVEPDRGRLLWWLATLSLGCGLTAPALVVTGLPGVALGLAAYRLAGRDLRAMAGGRMDPAGLPRTRRARRRAELGIALSAFGLAGWWICWCAAGALVAWVSDQLRHM